MQKNKQFHFIIEQMTAIPNNKLTILEESTTSLGHPKITFSSLLQEANVINKNKRKYDQHVLESVVSQLSPRAVARNLLMEVDHPMFFSGANDPELMKKRAAVVEINNSGAVCRKISFRNNQIIGEIETLSCFKGPELANLISKDKVDIGFSLRALGAVEPMHDGTLMVKTPIFPITYDVVSNPSHANARVLEFLPESDIGMIKDSSSIIYEGEEYELLRDEINFSNSNNYGIHKFLDDVIVEQFKTISTKIKFRF